MCPDPNKIFPNPSIPSLCYIKNVVKNPNIIVGDYTYYDDKDGAERFEEHVTHFYPFIGDKLIIGKFCAIARGIEFIMNGANHRMDGVTTYPFYTMGGDWGSAIAPVKDELPLKDTIYRIEYLSASKARLSTAPRRNILRFVEFQGGFTALPKPVQSRLCSVQGRFRLLSVH